MTKQPKDYGELKKRALLAKQRMKMGYWQQLMSERENMLISAGESNKAQYLVSEVQRAKFERDNNVIINRERAGKDEEMYIKVCRILESDEVTTNPIGLLMDQKEYESLDEFGRQRYVLRLSEKFRELKERYYKERIGKTS